MRQFSTLGLFLGWFGCGSGGAALDGPGDADTDTDTDADSDADTDADTDTDTTTASGFGRPDTLAVACAETDNALRFVCTVTVDPPQPVALTWVRTDGFGVSRERISDLAQGAHSVDVLFLNPVSEYTVEAVATAWPTEPAATTSLTTAEVPMGVRSSLSMTGTSTLGLIGTETPCDTGAQAVVYDTVTGALAWYQNLDSNGALGMLDMVRFNQSGTILGETDGAIVEVDQMGNDLVRFPVDYPGCCSLNHDIFPHDGAYWSQYQNIMGGLTLDNIVVIDALGTELYTWLPQEHLTIPPGANGDYLHTNSEYVDANGDFYLSWLTQDTIAKFIGDRASPDWGDPIWLMSGDGRENDLGNDIVIDWTGIDGANGFAGQHNAHLRNDGRLMFLDNDNGRALVMTVDDVTLTATVDAAYDTKESPCGAQGTAMDALSGNALVACGTAFVREYDLATSAMLWEAEVSCANGGGPGWTAGSATRWYPLDGWK